MLHVVLFCVPRYPCTTFPFKLESLVIGSVACLPCQHAAVMLLHGFWQSGALIQCNIMMPCLVVCIAWQLFLWGSALPESPFRGRARNTINLHFLGGLSNSARVSFVEALCNGRAELNRLSNGKAEPKTPAVNIAAR
eukprot:3175294-Amphidinium_carterae.1